jgi:hypothetical protein
VAGDEVVDEDLVLVRSFLGLEVDVAEVGGVLRGIEQVGAAVDIDAVGGDRAAVEVVGDVGFEFDLRAVSRRR